MRRSLGWRREPARHALASKGIKTRSRVSKAHLSRIEHGGSIRPAMGRLSSYSSKLRSLERKYENKDIKAEITEKDYEGIIQPLFDTVADADELAERGELKKSVRYINLANAQYEQMKRHFDAIAADDERQFESSVQLVSEKAVARSRPHGVPA